MFIFYWLVVIAAFLIFQIAREWRSNADNVRMTKMQP